MKRIFIVLLVLVASRSFSQSVIYTNDCSSLVSFSVASLDWLAGDFTALGIPACTVAGTSGAAHLLTQQISTSFEQIATNGVNTSTFVNIVVTWNMYRNSSSSPAVTLEWSNNGGSSWTAAAYSHTAGIGAWGAVPTVSLPAAAAGTTVNLRWTYTGTGNFNDYILIDDIKVSGTPNPSYYWNGSGALTSVGSWGINTDGTGTNPVDFVTPNQNFYLVNASSATLAADWTFGGSGSVLNIGDGTVPKAINFTIPTGFTLTVSSGAKISATNNSTLTILNTDFPASSETQLGSLSTINFAQTTGTTTIWATTYGNLSLSGGGVKAQGSGATSVGGSFVIASGVSYAMSNSPFVTTTLNGPIVCTGSISANTSNLSIGGSSVNAIGTLNFGGTGSIAALILNRSTQTLTLGSNLTLSGGLSSSQFTNGHLNLNGRLLTINGAVTFPASSTNGVFIGSSTSSISITGSGAITNNLLMSQASAAAMTTGFTLSRSSSTVTLGSDIIFNTATFTNGRLAMNGRFVTLNGATTFPAAISNGCFVGSTTSSLAIINSGALTNSLLMDQTSNASRSIGSFTLNRVGGTLTLGNNLTVSSDFINTNGIISINGTSLTLSGNITFPANALSRGFIGSSTSTLTIDGSGTISGSLMMNSGSILLDELTLNRTLATLTLGNTLETYGSVYPTSGTINSNGNLYIRSNATGKGRIAEVTGAVSGNIRVESFAPGGTTDWTNLGVAGVQGQTFANWDGQIPMTCSLCINDQMSAGGYFVSVQGWNEAAAASSTVAYVEKLGTDALVVGDGYWVFLGDALGSTGDIAWNVTGAAVTGNVTKNLSFSGAANGDGYNLLSNPYPSPISWDAAMSTNSVNLANLYGAIYTYNPDLGVTGSYAFGASSNGVTSVIPMGQGFYTQVAAALTFTFAESNKVKSNNPLLRPASVDYGSIVKLKVNDASLADEAVIRFHNNATTGFDKVMDANKIYSSPGYLGYPGNYTKRTSISTLSDGGDYSINSLPFAHAADAVIPVLVKVYASGQHTITGFDLENLPNSCVILKDKLTNTQHDLRTGPYVCDIQDTTTLPRFELRICQDIAMGIDDPKQEQAVNSAIQINNDLNGVYVKFNYEQATRSKITVTNILGQKVVDDKVLTTLDDKVYLSLDQKQQLLFITVTNDTQKVTKKIVR